MEIEYCTSKRHRAALRHAEPALPGAILIRTLGAMPVAVEELFARNTQSLTA